MKIINKHFIKPIRLYHVDNVYPKIIKIKDEIIYIGNKEHMAKHIAQDIIDARLEYIKPMRFILLKTVGKPYTIGKSIKVKPCILYDLEAKKEIVGWESHLSGKTYLSDTVDSIYERYWTILYPDRDEKIAKQLNFGRRKTNRCR